MNLASMTHVRNHLVGDAAVVLEKIVVNGTRGVGNLLENRL